MSDTLTSNVRDCERCDDDHSGLIFHGLGRPITTSPLMEWTHWAICPKTLEPLLRSLPNPPSVIVFVEAGATVLAQALADAECVIGVMPDGSGRVIKNREGPEGSLTQAETEWLRANPTKRPEDLPRNV